MRNTTLLLIALLVTPAASFADEVRWVGDSITIMMRTGKGNAFQIIRTLPSGTRLQMLEIDGDYARVQTEKGTEGWVLSRFLTEQPIAADRLVQAEARIEKLMEQQRALNEQVSALKSERSSLANELKGREAENARLEKELADLREVAASPIRLREENQAMRTRLGQLDAAIEELTVSNDALRNDSQREWFVTGAAVLGSGILLGLVLPLLKRRKKQRLYDF